MDASKQINAESVLSLIEYVKQPPPPDVFNEHWQLNHCYARIRILVAYCMFLLKRACLYRDANNQQQLVGFIKHQLHDITSYRSEVTKIEDKVARAQSLSFSQSIEADGLIHNLSAALEISFQQVAIKVAEKLPGETLANKLDLADEDVAELLDGDLEALRHW